MKKLLLLLFMFPIIHCSCPDGFELVAEECRMLKPITISIRDDQATDSAISQCDPHLSHPVAIHNVEQQKYWISKKRSTYYIPLGLVCNTSSLEWQWSDGSKVDYKPSTSEGGYYTGFDNDCTNGCVAFISNSTGFWTRWCDDDVEPFDVYCTAPSRQPIPSGHGCESFEDDSDDGVCYQVGAAAENWKEAQIICGSFGAQVASIHNEKENSFLRRLAVSKGAVSGMYLGASVSGKADNFSWIDGTTWNYDNFYSGFPITGLGDCIIMDTGSTGGEWANVDCSTKMSVACERKQGYTAPACSTGPWVEGQIMYSPGFPFDAATPCDFILSVDSGKKIELEVLLVEANPCCDHLIIYENYFGGTVIANLTGEVNDKKYTTSSSNFMRVSWQPTDGKNVRGAMFTYKAV